MAMRAMVWQGARHVPPTQSVSSAVKTFCGNRAVAVATRAIELLAADGAHVAGGAEKRFRDGRLNQIYEGTNQLSRVALVEALWDPDHHPRRAQTSLTLVIDTRQGRCQDELRALRHRGQALQPP